MIKRYKKINSNHIKRTSRVFLPYMNKGKEEKLICFLKDYQNVVNYFINVFWSQKDFSPNLPDSSITKKAVKKFGITARLSQCASKQAKEIIRSQKDRQVKTMPRFKKRVINADSRFVDISSFDGHFDMAIKTGSGLPKIVIPIQNTKHTLKFSDWKISKSVRIGELKGKIYIDLLYEKERPIYKTGGGVKTLDCGFNKLFTSNDNEKIGETLKPIIKSFDKRINRKKANHFISTEIKKEIKKINLEGVSDLVIENLKHVKSKKRGKLSRKTNRFLSFWHYAKAIGYICQICEENGIRVHKKDPWKTSQRCHICGNIDKKSRKNEKFLCTSCGYDGDADFNASKNLEFLFLAEAYSLRSLPNHPYSTHLSI